MSQSLSAGRNTWIISPLADLVCLVGTPLLIFPLAMLLSRHVLTPDQLAVGVLAFASFGHHLPGFLRAYGDRDLFRRYFWRFVLAPPLIAAAILAFAVMNLRGFVLILSVWATWHILMQTYGFLRIYDAKRGNCDTWSARLDFFACAAIFANGVVFSETRVFFFAEEFALAGLPTMLPIQLAALRWSVGAATAVLAVLYIVQLWRVSRSSSGMSWPKVLLLTTTGLLYWASGLLSTNLLVGVAMFEIFHAVQYYAVVWAYNRRVADRESNRLRPIRWLFRGNLLSLGLYFCAIALFGATFFSAKKIGGDQMQQPLLVLFSISACLHFYYDGFIWKIRERGTRSDLNIDSPQFAVASWSSGWFHALKWSALAVVAIALALIEYNGHSRGEADADRRLAELGRLTPDVPELQVRLAQSARRSGDTARAVTLARRAIARRPRSQDAHTELGVALNHRGQFAEAARSLRTAKSLGPQSLQIELELANALKSMRDYQAAEACFRNLNRMAPDAPEIQHAWAGMYCDAGDTQAAIEHYTAAIAGYRAACQGDSMSDELRVRLADANFERGVTKQNAKRYAAARLDFERALELRPEHAAARKQLAQALFMLASAKLQEGESETAVAILEECVATDASLCDAFNSLGAAYFDLNRLDKAADAYMHAIELNSDFAPSHFNLGLVYLERRQIEPARRCLARARELGQFVSPEVLADVGLDR